MHQIILIRHGEAAKSPNHADPGLTNLGQQQAKELAEHLQQQFPNGRGVRLISSPKSRALQTAMPVATRWNKEIEQEPRSIEIPSPEGLPLAARLDWIRALLNQQWDQLTNTQRLWRREMIDYLLQLEEPGSEYHTTLIFCHFMVINSVVAHIRNDLNVVQFHPDYTSQTRLNLQQGKLTVEELGQQKAIDNLIQ
ncbi:histidine phosphatase family protein [Microbulbifer sp. ALW1]|uniref:histidine phosphatase family protein n=1 Tax=Microbulbifer sp. (strain ALW1) TaxID=1516059 RepID=UPI00135883D3|nr:histidine phosphatase family protein [Microbulbifer sp. ALW1]